LWNGTATVETAEPAVAATADDDDGHVIKLTPSAVRV
jgi:hypothetical protein